MVCDDRKHSLQEMKKMSDIGESSHGSMLKMDKNMKFKSDEKGFRSLFDNSGNNERKRRNDKNDHSNLTTISDPSKVIFPTYNSFRKHKNNMEMNDVSISSNVKQYLIEETSDNYIKNAHRDFKLFLEICSCAFDQLPNSGTGKKKFLNQLGSELTNIIDRELSIVQFEHASPNDKLSPSQQTSILLDATENTFKIFDRVLMNHKAVLKVFENDKMGKLGKSVTGRKSLSLTQYSIETVWNEMCFVIKQFLEKYLDVNNNNNNTGKDKNEEKKSAVDELMSFDGKNDQDSSPSRNINISRMLKKNKLLRTLGGKGDNSSNNDNSNDKEDGFDADMSNIGGNLGGLDIGALQHIGMKDDNLLKAHNIATQQLTFSFSDSNVQSIVKGASSIYGNKGQKTATEFAATNKKRLSLTGLNLQDGSVVSNVMAQAAKMGHGSNGTSQNSMGLTHGHDNAPYQGYRFESGLARNIVDKNNKYKEKDRYRHHHSKRRNRARLGGTTPGSEGATGIGARSGVAAGVSAGGGIGARHVMNQQSKKFEKLLRSVNKISPTPYHIAALYRPVTVFVDNVESTLFDRGGLSLRSRRKGKGKGKGQDNEKIVNLRSFLHDFVSSIFVPKVVEDANQWLINIISGAGVLDQIKIVEDQCTMSRSVSQIYELIEETFEHFTMIPIFGDNEFASIILRILYKLVDMCKWVSKEIGYSFQSRGIINQHKEYMSFLSLFGLRNMLDTWSILDASSGIGVGDGKNDKSKSKTLSQKSEESIKKNSVNDWFMTGSKEFNYYNDLISEANKANDPNKINSLASNKSGFDTLSYSQLGNLATGLHWISNKISTNLINELKPNVSNLTSIVECLNNKCEPLSERCLTMIRVELRCQCVCYLRKMKIINYCLPDDKITKPQDFIITLNKLLVNCESKLNECLPDYLVKFIFVELSYFISDLIIELIPQIFGKKLNLQGYKQLWRNIFSLQQNLTTITQDSKEKCFDKCQKYLDLTIKDPKDIDVLIKKCKQYYLKYPNRRNNINLIIRKKEIGKQNESGNDQVTTSTLLLNFFGNSNLHESTGSKFNYFSKESVNYLLQKFETQLNKSYQPFFTQDQYLAVQQIARLSFKRHV